MIRKLVSKLRPQQHRLKWPLTPSQVEALDEMLQTLFKGAPELKPSSPTSSRSIAQVAARISLHI